MCLTEYDEERTMSLFKEEFLEEGRSEGRAKEQENIAARMIRGKMPLSEILKFTEVSPSRLTEISNAIGVPLVAG